MTALSKIEAAGFRVFLKGENLGIAPADNLTPSQREFLKSHKAEIINELHNQIVWAELPEPAHGALMVTCYTPAGNAIEVEAKNPAHAEFLQRINPKPQIH
jgi:hypothetical protein